MSLAAYAYDDLSRRTSVALGNGNIMSYAYNGDDTLQSLSHNLQGAVVANDVTLGYGYNQVDQINARSYTNNAYLWNGHYNINRPYASNGLNQYTASGSKTLSYDARGSLTGDGTWTFAYDVENRLKSANRSGLTSSFLYDPVGRLRQQTITDTVATKFLYDGDDMVAEYSTAGALLRRYIHGPGIDEPLAWYEGTALATKRYFQADHQGSIIAVTDGTTGAPISQFSYGPYGEPNLLTGSPFRYTGQRLVPGVGFYYYKARFYSPYLGRFLQTDPIGTADDMNMYAYVGNSPISRRDPSGLATIFIGGAGDQSFAHIVERYQAEFKESNPKEPTGYFTWGQSKDIEKYINSFPKSEPINVVGHSYGGDTAAHLAASGNVRIDNLVTIDPVGWSRPDGAAIRNNTTSWTNVRAEPKSYDYTDFIADVGGQYPPQNADRNYTSGANHADFSQMMREGNPSPASIIKPNPAGVGSTNGGTGKTGGDNSGR